MRVGLGGGGACQPAGGCGPRRVEPAPLPPGEAVDPPTFGPASWGGLMNWLVPTVWAVALLLFPAFGRRRK